MTIVITLAALTALIAVYALWLRPWMDRQESGWARRFLDWAEPIEIKLWRKSETILVARYLQVLGILLALLGFVSGLDPTMVSAVLPIEWAPYVPLALTLAGWLQEQLRQRTTKPIEVVSIPSNAPPEVRAIVAEAAAANAVAVDVVNSSKP